MAAIEALIRIDADFAGILERAGPLPWRTRTAGFPGLLQAIVAQMISNQAAAAIWGRLRAVPGALEPAVLIGLPDEVLRAAGLSRPKVVHARALAKAFVTIGSIKGLGRWTAEIYLLFALGRLDVFPSGDIALAAALADLKGLADRPAPKALREMAMAWQPVRSLAARLLWHHWRLVTGRPAMDDFRGV